MRYGTRLAWSAASMKGSREEARAMWMVRGAGALVALHVLVACGLTDQADPPGSGSGGTESQGQGGTESQGQGGTLSQGQGSTGFDGPGTHPSEPGDFFPDSDGNMAVDAGVPGAGGTAGAGGAGACEDRCAQCREGYVLAACDSACICESEYVSVKEDHQDLLACDFAEPCPESVLNRYPGSASWEGGECLLSALRDRTPGRYRFRSTFSDIGSQTSEYTLLVTGSDQVIVLESSMSGLVGQNLERQYLETRSCTLQDYDTLDACVAAGTDLGATTTGGDGGAVCADAADWVRDCDGVRNLACPGEQ